METIWRISTKLWQIHVLFIQFIDKLELHFIYKYIIILCFLTIRIYDMFLNYEAGQHIIQFT